jgi:platelet-activating factor acetylhydrolase
MPPPTPNPSERKKQPKPPLLARSHIQHALPPYTGPYPRVGFLEMELPARHPRALSPHIKRNDEFALKLDTVLFAVYYPSEPGSASASGFGGGCRRGEDGDGDGDGQGHGAGGGGGEARRKKGEKGGTGKAKRKKVSRVPWLPRPRASTCKGYARFLNVPHLPVTAYMAVTSMFTKLPVHRNGRLSRRWPGEAAVVREEGRKRAGTGTGTGGDRGSGADEEEDTLGDADADADADADGGEGHNREKPKFPVVIFSHGLGGSRTLYSSICGELASHGLVVVAMEHRDGSGARTFVNKAGKAEDLESQGVDKTAGPPKNVKKSPERQQKDQETKPYYKIDYLFPKDNAQDTSPHNPDGVDKELRGAQIDMRIAEIEEAFYVLGLINNGHGDRVRRDNLRKEGNVGSSSAGLDGIDWQHWTGRLDLKAVTMMGHSFGGATTVQMLRSDKLPWITQGILLDPWGPATPECTEQNTVHKPVLSVGSEAFMHWAENFDCIEQVCHEARASGTLSWMTTIRGSTHLSQTDFAILYPHWMSLLIKTVVDPERAISLTVHSALEFLKLTLPRSQTRLAKAWPGEQLLGIADSETEVLSDHRPDDKWVAARLKLPNEFSVRLRGILEWNASARWPKGMVSRGGVENEIWCHQSPDRDSMERYMRRNGRLSVSSNLEGSIH